MQWRSERVVVSRHVCYGLDKEVTQSQGMPKITVLVPPPVLPSPARRNRRRNEPGPGPSKHSALPTQRSKRESKGETHYGIPSARSRVSGRCDVLFSPADRANVCVDQHRSALAVVMAETTAGSHLGDAGQRWGGKDGKAASLLRRVTVNNNTRGEHSTWAQQPLNVAARHRGPIVMYQGSVSCQVSQRKPAEQRLCAAKNRQVKRHSKWTYLLAFIADTLPTQPFRRRPLARPNTQSSPDAQDIPDLCFSDFCWQDAVRHSPQDVSSLPHPSPPQLVSTQTTIRALRNDATTASLPCRLDREPSSEEHKFQQQSLVVLGPEQHNPLDTCALPLSLAGADTLR